MLQLAGAFGPRAEGGNLPAAGNFVYGGANIKEKFVYYTIQLSGPVLALSKGDKNSFADALKLTMDAAFMEFRLNMNTIVHLAGNATNFNGVVGKVSTTAASSIVLVDNNLQSNWFYPGMTVDSYTSGGTSHDTGLIVSSVSGTTINFTTAITNTAAADFITFAGVGGPTGTTSPDGLLNGIDDGTYQTTYMNLSRTTYPIWKSYFNANASTRTIFGSSTRRSTTPNLIQTAIDGQAALAGSQRPIDLIYSDLAVRRLYWQALASDRRFPDGMYDGGWKGLKFSNGDIELPWMASAMCNKYTIWLMHTGKHTQGSESSDGGGKNPKAGMADKVAEAELFAVYQTPEGAPDWDSEGGVLKQIYGNSGANFVDARGAYLKWYLNIATLRPNAHAVIDDVLEA